MYRKLDLQAEISLLKHENALLKEQVKTLEAKVLQLLEIIEQYGIKKDSHNSHLPSSRDLSKPKHNKSLRPKTGRKPGGQKGHKGTSLKMTDTPDEFKILRSHYCQECGADLSSLPATLVAKRQEVILPPISPKYIEYQQYACSCDCGHYQKAPYPPGINAPIQFGSNITALVSYFNVFQYVPYQRLKLLFKDIFNLSISEGSIQNLLNKSASKSELVYKTILEELQNANYIGSDETGAKVNGKKWWIWVWQNIENTFLKASESRGFSIVETLFPNGLPNATIGSDRWAAQLKIASKAKQLCFPHLQRDLNYLIELENNDWSVKFKALLTKALSLRKLALQKNKAYHKNDTVAKGIEKQLNNLLVRTISKEQFPKTLTFQKSMIKYRNYLFTCLYDLEVPPDNNASERAIRNVKVKQKISGQFKSGQDTFCILRSIIDTLRKRGLDILLFLKLICQAENLQPE